MLGIQARKRIDTGRGKALAAIVLGGAMVAIMIAWTIAESLRGVRTKLSPPR